MKYDYSKHNRRSIRLQGYDYSLAGAYFVTICAQDRTCLFGKIMNGEMVLNDAGRMVAKWYMEIENKFVEIRCDEFICMPNHVHFVGINVGADLRVCPNGVCPGGADNAGVTDKQGAHNKQGAHIGAPLRAIVQWFKTMSTNEYIRGVKQHGWPRFPGKLRQRNYYEHIIRNGDELNRIREYIINNPAKWETDNNHPGHRTNNVVAEPLMEYGNELWMV